MWCSREKRGREGRMAFIGGVAVRRGGASCAPQQTASTCRRRPVVHAVEQLEELSTLFCGTWSNEQQAVDNPPFFAHIHQFAVPLPDGIVPGKGLIVESYYDFVLKQEGPPYLTVVLSLVEKDGEIYGYKCSCSEEDQATVVGASLDSSKLEAMKPGMFKPSADCCSFKWKYSRKNKLWSAKTVPGKLCGSKFKGVDSYFEGTYTVTKDGTARTTWDVGRDKETNEILWGSVGGPFEFKRTG